MVPLPEAVFGCYVNKSVKAFYASDGYCIKCILRCTASSLCALFGGICFLLSGNTHLQKYYLFLAAKSRIGSWRQWERKRP